MNNNNKFYNIELIKNYSKGILSAYGMALADVVYETQAPADLELNEKNLTNIRERLDNLSEACYKNLEQQNFTKDRIVLQYYLHLRYDGTDCALMVSPILPGNKFVVQNYGDFYTSFLERYQSEFGFTLQNRRIIVDDIRVRGCGKSSSPDEVDIEKSKLPPIPERSAQVFFEKGYEASKVYLSENLKAGDKILGPAVLIDKLSTILIEPDSSAVVTLKGDIVMTVENNNLRLVNDKLDPIQLSIFSHRFMSIAEQMGRVLQRTSISTNIKERLDFSCALFGPDGGLVSNAPHIPVHLGAMQVL